jgi:hypothetical protein
VINPIAATIDKVTIFEEENQSKSFPSSNTNCKDTTQTINKTKPITSIGFLNNSSL